MTYLIDGHNLVPKLGLRLDSIDDELELIDILKEFCRIERKHVEVYFDRAPQARTRKLGPVTAHFVRLGMTADDAIRDRLKKLGKSAKNWTVVSSDRQVQTEARAVHAAVLSADSFAAILKRARSDAPKSNGEQKTLSEEIDYWLKRFGDKKD